MAAASLGILLLTVVFALVEVQAASINCKLPPYLKPCRLDEPDLTKCAIEHASHVIPHILSGDRKYHVPSFEPLAITELGVDNSAGSVGLSLTMKNVTIHGLTQSKLTDIRIDLDNHHVEFHLDLPKIFLLAKYNISGRILLFPIFGNGDGNVTLFNTKIVFKIDYKLEKRKDIEYMVLVHSELDFNNKKALIHLDNLFNGDPILNPNSDAFIQENSRALVDQMGPSIAQGIAAALKQVVLVFTECVPYNQIFLV